MVRSFFFHFMTEFPLLAKFARNGNAGWLYQVSGLCTNTIAPAFLGVVQVRVRFGEQTLVTRLAG